MSINKQKLLDILGSPKDMSDKDLEELENAVRQYPYFQLGHSLISKAKYDRQTPDAYDSLSLAAIYAPDRSVLKKIFYDKLSIVYQSADAADIQTVAEEPAEVALQSTEPIEEIESDTMEEEISSESEVIPEEEEVTPPLLEEQPEQKASDTAKTIEESKITEGSSTEEEQEEQEINAEKKEVDEEVYQELQKNLENLRQSKIKFEDEEEDEEGSDKKKTLNESDALENEAINTTTPSDPQKSASSENVKNTREKGTSRLLTEISALKPLPFEQIKVKQQTQFSLIDKFINTQPEIVYRDQSDLNVKIADLSEKSTLTRDHLLTENFAAIMCKQGKVDKAIEIYRKLIWKFPQKKAYFASKVKALKESE